MSNTNQGAVVSSASLPAHLRQPVFMSRTYEMTPLTVCMRSQLMRALSPTQSAIPHPRLVDYFAWFDTAHFC